MSSEGAVASKEKSDVEEEARSDVATPVEELAAARPSTAQEVPAHLRKQQVRKLPSLKLHF